MKKLFETTLYSKNLIEGINTWAVLLVRFSGLFLKLTREINQKDQRIRKLMTMYKALHPRDDVDRLFVSRNGERGLVSIEDSVNTLIQRLEDYIEKARRMTDYSHQKQYWRDEDQQNKNNQKNGKINNCMDVLSD